LLRQAGYTASDAFVLSGRAEVPSALSPESRAKAARSSLAGWLGNGEEGYAGMEVEVAVHASEQAFLRPPAAPRAEHDKVVATPFDLFEPYER
jgi:hypothetical protein